GTQWIETHHLALALPNPWPRDPRARLRKTGTHLELFLPGAACEGEAAQTLLLNCHATSDPWVLESGARSLLLANFAGDRNYFDGKLVLQDGTRRTVPPFYSAAALDDPNGTTWLLALVDGTIELFHPASGTEEPLTAAPWGSDLVAVSACTNGSQILATRGVEGQQPDALQAFSISNRTAHPSAAPLSLEGPIRALWPAGPASALTVIVDPAVHKYRAYAVSLVCGS
ncbi:MAG: hypothetical protein JO099_11105, partial [Acidobacteriia bacterium]|nr:hypothetical protein [Terriglobia bacterium]